MKRTASLTLLAAPVVAFAVACGGGTTSQPVGPPAHDVAITQPDPSQYAEAHALAAKLGCPKVVVTQSGGASVAAVETSCSVTPPTESPYSQYNYQLSVYPDDAAAQTAISQLRAAYNPSGAASGRWVVTTTADPDAVQVAVTRLGGMQL